VIHEAIDLMDLSAIEGMFHVAGAGAPAYPPKMLLKLLTYGYMTQRFSSRRISAACREDLGMMWLAQMENPKHSVLADFRQCHVEAIPGWVAQIGNCLGIPIAMVGLL